MGVNLVGTPSYSTTAGAGYIASSCDYNLILEQNKVNCGNYNANDNLWVVGYNNGDFSRNDYYTSIGLSTAAVDGTHHRGFIKAIRDIANSTNSTAGRITLGVRATNGDYCEVIHATSCQRVGIGTCTPSTNLEVWSSINPTTLTVTNTAASGIARLTLTNASRSFILTNNAGDDLLSFSYNASNRLQFNLTNQWFNSGNVGVGTSSPQVALDVRGSTEGLHIYRDAGNAPDIRLKTSNGSVTSPTVVSNGQLAGQIHFETYDGSNYLSRTAIFGCVSGAPSVGNVPVDMLFFAGSTSRTERMRITAGGKVGIGTSSPCTVLSVTTNGGSYTVPDNTDTSNIYVYNSNSTCTTAHSILTLRTNNTGGGNPFISFDVNQVTGWSLGLDNADSDKFKLGWGWSSLSANTALTVTTSTLNVGIGTTSPLGSSVERTLHLSDAGNGYATLYVTNAANTVKGIVAIASSQQTVSFGSQSNHALRLITNDTTKMLINTGGCTGIGTTTPCTMLSVKGGATSTKTDILSISTFSGAGVQPVLRFDSIEANCNVLGRISTCDLGVFSSAMIFETADCKSLGDSTTTERMRIVGCTGNVGIGTTSPGYSLDVAGGMKGNFYMSCCNATIDGTGPYDFGVIGTGNGAGALLVNDVVGARYTIHAGSYNLTFRKSVRGTSTACAYCTVMQFVGTTDTNCIVNVSIANRLGIATTSPSYALHVNGTFYAAGSSIKYKEGICNYDTNSCLFMCLKPVAYQYKDEFKHLGKELKADTQIGLIAEDVAEVMPELAVLVNEEDEKVVRNVDYEKLSIVLLAEVQKLRKEMDELKQSC